MNLCHRCGQSFGEHSVRGLCPRCLGELAFARDEELALEPEETTATRRASQPGDVGIGDRSPDLDLRRFGDFELLEEIARGGMGVVFKARQRSLGRTVALKLLLSGHFASVDAVARFRAEAVATATLHHAYIVPIYEVGEAHGQPYLVMEYVPGRNLADAVRDAPMPARRAAEIVRRVAEALQHAHDHGILHRDLKPSNILLDEYDQPRITDFGLAKRIAAEFPSAGAESGAHLTLTGQVLGTPAFLSPEQAAGKRDDIGPASDVYSLGAVLYFLTTGRPPFTAGSLEETLRQVREEEPVSPRLLNPGIERDLETLCLKCLSKESNRRYRSAHDVAEELDRHLRHEPIRARPVGLPGRFGRWCRRKPAVAALAIALHLVGALGLAGILWQWKRAEQLAAQETAQRQRAETAVTSLQLQRAEAFLEDEDVVMGMASLARLSRQDPTNLVVTARVLAALTQRDFVLPVSLPLQHQKKVNHAEFSPDGRWVVTASLDDTAQLWDSRTGHPVGGPLRHAAAVRIARFSPDGQRLATVTDDPIVLLWETATQRPIGQPIRHKGWVRDAHFSPNGRSLVTASDDRTARLWDGLTGEPSSIVLPHTSPVRRARFSPEGRWIVTLSNDAAARVWEASSGSAVGAPITHRAEVVGAQFSPDGERLVTASFDGTARVWRSLTGEPMTEGLRHRDRVSSAEFSPDGQRVVTASEDGLVRIWDVSTGSLLASMPHGNGVVFASFCADGQRLLTGYPDNALRVWDSRSAQKLAAPFQHDGLIWSTSLSPHGEFAVSASADKTARLWDLRPGRALDLTLPHPARVESVHFSPDGNWLVTAARDHTVRVWSVKTGQPRTPPLALGSAVATARFGPDGRQILTVCVDGTARLWDAQSGQPLTESLRQDDASRFGEFSPDGRWFLTTSSQAIRLWDAASGTPHSDLIRREGLSVFAHFSPNSRSVVFGLNEDDSAHILEIPTGRKLVELRGHTGFIADVSFSTDGGRVVTASEDGSARVWGAATGVPLTPTLLHKAFVYHAEFSRDGSLVVTASADGTARVWDASTGRAVSEPLSHRGRLFQARFSPDGQLVLTTSTDGTARLWHARTGRPVAEPMRFEGGVLDATFSPDGRHLAACSQDGYARIRELPFLALFRAAPDETSPPNWTPATGSNVPSSDPEHGTQASAGSSLPGILLANLVEAVIGQRLGDGGSLEPVSPHRLMELRAQLGRRSPPSSFGSWLAWFLEDRSIRRISPNSNVTVPEYVALRIADRTLPGAREAVLLSPTNALALAHLAEMLTTSPNTPGPAAAAEAAFLLRRAQMLAPSDPTVQDIARRLSPGDGNQRPVR